MERKPLIIIPYRDRQVHLDCLLSQLQKYFPHIPVCIVEQDDSGTWNKGLLFNAAVKEVGREWEYYILHDVDFIPTPSVNYSPTDVPCLLSTECSQFNYTYLYPTFFGGVVGIPKEMYELINGFSNQFKGYGGEDDLLYNSFIQKGVQPIKCNGNRFENFIHPKPDIRPGTEYYYTPNYQNNLTLATSPRDFEEGLSTAQYTVTEKEVRYRNIQGIPVIHLKVKTV